MSAKLNVVIADGQGYPIKRNEEHLEQKSQELDLCGGLKTLTGTRTGFFHIEKIGGRHWMVTPLGHAFMSVALSLPSLAELHTSAEIKSAVITISMSETHSKGSSVWDSTAPFSNIPVLNAT